MQENGQYHCGDTIRDNFNFRSGYLRSFQVIYRLKTDLKYQKSFKWIVLNKIDKNVLTIMNFI